MKIIHFDLFQLIVFIKWLNKNVFYNCLSLVAKNMCKQKHRSACASVQSDQCVFVYCIESGLYYCGLIEFLLFEI